MNTGTGGPRRRRQAWPQRAGLLAAMAGVAVLTVACSGNPASAGSSGSPQSAGTAPSASSNAVAFAQCMRAHGVPSYPDPSSVSGPIDENQLGVSGTVYETAKTTCQRLYRQPQSAGLTTAQQQQVEAKLLNFAECMRSHGLPSFPDPNPASTIWGSGGSGQLFAVPSSINPNSPQSKSASNACKSQMPGNVAIRGNKGGS
jgi:hypothetical protein